MKRLVRGAAVATAAAYASCAMSTDHVEAAAENDEHASELFHHSLLRQLDDDSSDKTYPAGYIVNGETATKHRYHWFAGLLYKRCEGERCGWARTACGASLIHPDVLLTSAHCIPYLQDVISDNAAYIGMHSPLETFNGLQSNEIIPIAEYIVHPDYDDISQANDVALLKLERPSTMTSVGLDDGSTDTASLTALGFGVTDPEGAELSDTLQELNLYGVPVSQCSSIYDNYYSGNKHIKPDMLCAKALKYGADTCTADSGGPLFVPGATEEQDVQVGVTSWGVEGCKGEYPGVYSSVSYHLAYIRAVVCRLSTITPEYNCNESSNSFTAEPQLKQQRQSDKKGFFKDPRRGTRASCRKLRRMSKRRVRKAKKLCREMLYKSYCPVTCNQISVDQRQGVKARKSCLLKGMDCQEDSLCCSGSCSGDQRCS